MTQIQSTDVMAPAMPHRHHGELDANMAADFVVCAFYRFVALPDYENVRETVLKFCKNNAMKGTILLASEGVNSTVAAAPKDMRAFWDFMDEDERLAEIPYKLHVCEFQPFEKMKVRLKKEIVRLAFDELDMANVGDYVRPAEWDALIADPDVVVVDTRNNYEVLLGTFEGAVNPKTEDFRSFPEWVDENLDPAKNKKIAMFCTGGIRCEKSTALLKQKGFDEVYHLQGGILQYLKDTKNESGKWQGNCFVFDDRVTLDDSLNPQSEYHCHKCDTVVSMDEIRWLSGNQKGAVCKNCSDDKERLAKVS